MRVKFLSLILFPILLSCAPIGQSEPENPDVPFTEITESSEFFPLTENAGEYEFFTNDKAFIKPYGMTFWAPVLAEQPLFTEIDISLSKISGNPYTGFGVVFCHGLRGEPLEATMLVLMINLNQEYIVGEVVKDRFNTLIPWTHSGSLHPGFNQENRVRISFNEGQSEFQIYINDMTVALDVFKDDEAPFHRGGTGGFITVISPRDKFPEIPVHVLFKNNQ